MHRHAHRVLKSDPVMAALIDAGGPCRLSAQERCEPFQALAQAIVHQQLHGAAARNILGRLVAQFAPRSFPTPEQLLAAPDSQLRSAGLSFAKIAALKDLARKCLDGTVPPAADLRALPDLDIIERLTQVRGIGRWTVEMMLMFQLDRHDVLPVDDFGVRNGFRLAYGLRAMPTPRALAEFGERWKPYRSMAAWYLWRAVDLARAQRLPPSAAPPPRIKLVKPRKKKKKKAAASRRPRSRRKAAGRASARPK